MDTQAYIESGILEAYVLDALSPAERAEVEVYISGYPEIAAEVAAIEDAIQKYAEAHAVNPPAHLQEQIWGAISAESAGVKGNGSKTQTIPLAAPEERRRHYNWANAAMLLVLVGSLGVNIMLWSQKNKADTRLANIEGAMSGMQQQQAELMREVAIYKQEKDMMADTAMLTVSMKSMVPGHPMAATVYWNRSKGEAYLSMQKLPMPEKGKQYQMWVIQNGVPVSMGVLPVELVEGKLVAKLPMEVKSGEAFAISLEKSGGSPTPTAVYVLGKVNA